VLKNFWTGEIVTRLVLSGAGKRVFIAVAESSLYNFVIAASKGCILKRNKIGFTVAASKFVFVEKRQGRLENCCSSIPGNKFII
jgi:hypothetical protein